MFPLNSTDHLRHEPLTLRAGPLHLLYEHGMLRSVCFGTTEIVRRIYMALRDDQWNTIPYTITNLNIDTSDSSFLIGFTARHLHATLKYTWNGLLCGTSEGVISATLDGTAESSFLRNRIGWCVLHPLSLCRSAPCEVTDRGGTVVQTHFPGDAIAPQTPFPPFTVLRYPAGAGTCCTCTFSGDLFELEDQRNWTDASFKTYSTPQSLPVPIPVEKGSTVSQTVTVSLDGEITLPHDRTVIDRPPQIVIPALAAAIIDRPQIGLGISMAELLTISPISLPHRLPADYLRLEIDAHQPLPEHLAATITAWCTHHRVGIELALYLSDNFITECTSIAALLAPCGPSIMSVLLLHRDFALTRAGVTSAGQKAFSYLSESALFFAGTDRYFVELNRAEIPKPPAGICFSANPQVHTTDSVAIMENIEGLGEVFRNVRILAEERPIALSPLTLRPRKNPLRPTKDGGADARQPTSFTAAWLTGALATAIDAGIHSLTLFTALTGTQGIMHENGYAAYPTFRLLELVAHQCRQCSARIIGSPPRLAAIYGAKYATGQLLLSNCSEKTQLVDISDFMTGLHYTACSIEFIDTSEMNGKNSLPPHERSPAFGTSITLPGHTVVHITLL